MTETLIQSSKSACYVPQARQSRIIPKIGNCSKRVNLV